MGSIRSRHAGGDSATSALAMALFAMAVGYSIHISKGYYSPRALLWLTIGLVFCAAAIVLPALGEVEWLARRSLAPLLAVGIAMQAALLMTHGHCEGLVCAGVGIILFLGWLQFFDLHRLRIPVIVIMAATFVVAAGARLNSLKDPPIDVYLWQQSTSAALMHGTDPYEVRIPNLYRNVRFYGPGLTDQHGYVTFGFPYPPLSLLMVLPGFLVRGDIRYALTLAVAVSATLMALARPEEGGADWSAGWSAVLDHTPRVLRSEYGLDGAAAGAELFDRNVLRLSVAEGVALGAGAFLFHQAVCGSGLAAAAVAGTGAGTVEGTAWHCD